MTAQPHPATAPAPLALAISLRARPGARQRLADALAALSTHMHAEATPRGLLSYDVFEEEATPGAFFIFERWPSRSVFNDFLAAPIDALATFFAIKDDLVAGEIDVRAMRAAG